MTASPSQDPSELTPEAWNARWQENNTPWDIQGATPALIAWQKQHGVKNQKIMVPGCGRGHDAYYLAKQGAWLDALDYAPDATLTAKETYSHKKINWRVQDVTKLTEQNQYDRIWEYTCFCALSPELRPAYLDGIQTALKLGGAYWGMVFLAVPNPDSGPPFQITPEAFKRLLESRFQIKTYEPNTPRSIKARKNTEIWFEVVK